MINPADLLLALATHDSRIYCAFNISRNEYLYSNPAFRAFFQLMPEEATPRLLYEMVHFEDRNYMRAHFESIQPGDIKENLEFRILQRNKIYFLRLNMMLTETEAAERIVTAYIDDITSFKASVDSMEALSNKKNAVLNILSHDLAGPLGSISNYSYLLAKKADPKDEFSLKLIHSIESITKRCIRLVQEFVKLEFLESAAVDLVTTRHNLVKSIAAFLEDYLQHEGELKKTIRFVHEEDQIFAIVDDYKFMQVINNLLSNALKFTPDGGTIEVRLRKIHDLVHVEVADTGIGIPDEFHSTLFDKFSKARRAGLKGETSVGLGMSIIKTIIDWHKGKIWFESKVGVGTTFYIEIPGSH